MSEYVTEEEWLDIQEKICQARLGVSRQEFLDGWASGRYSWSHDLDDHCDIAVVAIMFRETSNYEA